MIIYINLFHSDHFNYTLMDNVLRIFVKFHPCFAYKTLVHKGLHLPFQMGYMTVEEHSHGLLHLKRSPGIRSWSVLIGKVVHRHHQS